MKVYKSIDGLYFDNEENARNRCNFLNQAAQHRNQTIEDFHGKIEGNHIDYTTYEEIDLCNPETVVELLNDYNNLKKDIESIKEWVHFKEN